MLANAKYIYTLDMWTVEKGPNGWYFSKSAYHGDKREWRGPYASEFSALLRSRGSFEKKSRNAISSNRFPACSQTLGPHHQ
jgi:hypothetical protein